ncbi:hypothetical protein DNTS_003879 [Danionella cerebrum]|uniref:FIP-RBD domain-containing protein n=1 Tax=Danionella cerebrum TaxID=2873325 RepID=A0A553N2D1_9TELE|nr:hypothetical protein DNTS_003879 [Danionella translucida]
MRRQLTMDANVFPDQQQLLVFLKKLKEVFDVCDEDADGYIRVEHFVDLGLQFGQGDEVKKLAKYLDPDANGKINFKDFCHGVFAIKGCEEILKTALGTHNVTTQPYQTDNGYYYQHGEDCLGPPIIVCTRPYPDCQLYSDEEVMGRDPQESDMDSAADSGAGSETSEGARHDDKEEALGRLFLHGNNCGQMVSAAASVISVEEQFEDYGEGEDKIRHLYNSELLDVYCSQCCKKVNLLNDLEARLKNLKANSQLFQHSNFSSSHGSTEDLFRDSIDSCDVDITEKVSYLEKKITELENDSLANGDLKSKLKHENTQLVHRVHELEEQIKDQEMRAEQTLEEELKRHREAYSKMERDKGTEIELLSNRVQQLEEENAEMKVNVCRLKSQTEKLDQEKQRMTDKLEDTSLRLKDEMDLYRKMMDKLWQNRHEFQKEREAMQELIEDLRRELEHLQLFKLETEKPGRGRNAAGLSEYNAKTREIELEHEENHKLRDQNDDLNGQILSLSLYEAKNLFACHTKAQSLAAEIDNASRDELVDALKEQEEINFRLRQYMDKIILAILDHNPSILEIKH